MLMFILCSHLFGSIGECSFYCKVYINSYYSDTETIEIISYSHNSFVLSYFAFHHQQYAKLLLYTTLLFNYSFFYFVNVYCCSDSKMLFTVWEKMCDSNDLIAIHCWNNSFQRVRCSMGDYVIFIAEWLITYSPLM